MNKQNGKIWSQVCKHLREILSKDIYERWIAVIQCVEETDDSIRLAVVNDFYREWLEENYFPVIRKAAMAVTGREMDITLLVDSSLAVPAEEKEEKKGKTGIIESIIRPSSTNLNKAYTFESFVVGPSNEFAHAAAMAAAKSPSRAYNPLFIYGDVGLGKTHLMQAIGNYAAARKIRMKICYITCEQFLNEYINHLRNNSIAAFRKKYRKIDLLLIDDIHFLSGKERVQEEFFHTFNTLFENHKQIVLTSDRTPREMAGLAPRLVSRFEWGLVTELTRPDVETRIAILRKKAELMNLQVEDHIIEYLAERISSNIRSLEGALLRVSSYISLVNRPVSTEKIDELVKDLLDRENRAAITFDLIQRVVAEHFDLRRADLLGKKRTRDIAWPRQIAMHLSREMTQASFPVIGEAFGRNHATIMHAHRQVSERLRNDRALRQTITLLQDKILRAGTRAMQTTTV